MTSACVPLVDDATLSDPVIYCIACWSAVQILFYRVRRHAATDVWRTSYNMSLPMPRVRWLENVRANTAAWERDAMRCTVRSSWHCRCQSSYRYVRVAGTVPAAAAAERACRLPCNPCTHTGEDLAAAVAFHGVFGDTTQPGSCTFCPQARDTRHIFPPQPNGLTAVIVDSYARWRSVGQQRRTLMSISFFANMRS